MIAMVSLERERSPNSEVIKNSSPPFLKKYIMNEPVAVIIGAAIAAISGLSAVLLTSWRQSRLEYDKWLRAKADENNKWLQLREDDRQKDIRLAIVELTRKLAIGIHIMTWFTWKAKYTSTNFTKEDILKYDQEMKAILPEIVASHMWIAALNKKKYEKIAPLVKKMYKLDSQIAQGYNVFQNSTEEGIQLLSNYYDMCREFSREFETEVSEIISYVD